MRKKKPTVAETVTSILVAYQRLHPGSVDTVGLFIGVEAGKVSVALVNHEGHRWLPLNGPGISEATLEEALAQLEDAVLAEGSSILQALGQLQGTRK